MDELESELDAGFKSLLFDGIFSHPGVLEIERALICLASDERVQSLAPGAADRLADLQAARESGDTDKRETELLSLYLILHGAGAGYRGEEREKINNRQGIECLPGGIVPLVLSSRLIGPQSVVADLGCGNGLQGLLLQSLQPHRRTIQAELSGSLISTGRLYQEVLGLKGDSVYWFHGDIFDLDLEGIDLIYLYRPVRPSGQGTGVYRRVAARLSTLSHAVSVVSMADCLKGFLGLDFCTLYQNYSLSIFTTAWRKPGTAVEC